MLRFLQDHNGATATKTPATMGQFAYDFGKQSHSRMHAKSQPFVVDILVRASQKRQFLAFLARGCETEVGGLCGRGWRAAAKQWGARRKREARHLYAIRARRASSLAPLANQLMEVRPLAHVRRRAGVSDCASRGSLAAASEAAA